MDGSSAFRRAFHLASPVFLAYYLLPEDLGGGISRTAATLLFLGTAACIEIARMALRIPLLGLRGYEGRRVSAYAQGSLGLAIGLFLIQDPRIVVPVFLGMAWIDPLAAFARRRGWPRAVITAAYFGLFFGTASLMNAFAPTYALLYGAVATVCAILVEGPKLPQVDDDLLMQVVPYTVLFLLVGSLGTGWPGSL